MNKPATFSAPFESASDFTARFTTAEFLAMSETGAFDNMKVELVNGRLERMTPPKSGHGGRQAKVMIRLARLIDESRLMGEVGLDLGHDTTLACDVAVLRAPIDQNRLLLPEDILLVVEIAETTVARDLGLKRLAYAAASIPHYWVVDGVRSVMHVHTEPRDGDYAMIHTVRFGQPLPVPGTATTIVID